MKRAGVDLAEAFDNVLRGWVEAKEMDLHLGDAFLRLQKRVLHAAARRPALAEKIVDVLLQRLAAVADTMSESRLQVLFRSRLLQSALRVARGLDAEKLAAAFKKLRPVLPEELANSAIWLALIFGTEIDGEIDPSGSLESPDRFETLRSRLAFAQAREVVSHPAFTS